MPYYEYAQPPPTAADRLRDLGSLLRDVAQRVRDAVTEAVGETVGRIAKDAARRWLDRASDPPPRRSAYSRSRDDWDEDECDGASGVKRGPLRRAARTVLAGLFWAAGWCLRRRYPPLAAVAAAAAAMTASGWKNSNHPAADIAGAAAGVLAAHRALSSGADALDPH